MANIMSFNKDDHCQLYWIHRKSHTDILTQGYIGVSTNVESRFSVHKSCLKNKDSPVIYRSDFREAMDEDDLVFEVILKSTQEYCLYMENKLRPSWCIGWNIAAGGNGGTGTRGMSKTRQYKAYHTMKAMAEESGYTLADEWLGDDGLLSFIEFYNKNKVGSNKIIRIVGNPVFKDTVVFSTHSEVTTLAHAKYTIDDSGRKYSVKELSELFNIRANTISTNLCRGKTVRESVGLDKSVKRLVVVDSGEYEYCGKLSDEDFLKVKKLYETGSTLTSIGKIVNMDSGSLSRLVRKYGFERIS